MTGLLIVLGLFAIWGLLFYLQRRRKANQKPHMWREIRGGLGVVEVTRDVSEEEAIFIANRLQLVKAKVYAICLDVYPYNDNRYIGLVGHIGVANVAPSPEHPVVSFSASADDILLRLDPGMYYEFARECHNVFRYRMHGRAYITQCMDPADLAKANEVRARIEQDQEYFLELNTLVRKNEDE